MSDRAPAMWLYGCHGGAGVSVLEQLWAPMADAHGQLREMNLLVCSATFDGIAAAHRVLLEAKDNADTGILGAVVVHRDSSKMPRDTTLELQKIKHFTEVWHFPFMKQIAKTRIDDLPTWEPGVAGEPQHRFRRLTNQSNVLATAGEIGDQICREFVRRITE
ncbi:MULTISPECIES: hypothetical protein [Corynebacterium]|uniref:hypothetical protein n=1 Tax=Corynebacterium TaxID=1716 RepID=UPI0008A23EE2|nr:hypothetical protein [Corynebacterium sp. HMSC08D02]OFT30017.1 hypothetical protein HMPREF3170_05490 [Corynebacterium sp. HMSC08D02]